jgi:hypothetical protein
VIAGELVKAFLLLVTWLLLTLPCALVASAATGAEWAQFTEPNSPAVSAGIEEQDHGALLVMCGEAHKLPLTAIYHEPRANWQKGQSVDVLLGLDDGPNLPPWHADALDSATLGVSDWNQNIWMMGQAKTSFTITAGGYTRVISAKNFRQAMQPVLQACGQNWDHVAKGTAMKAFLLLVTWFTPGQPTINYQTPFSSSETCETARLQVIKDAERMKQDLFDRYRQSNLPPMVGTSFAAAAAPSVSAVCVAQ